MKHKIMFGPARGTPSLQTMIAHGYQWAHPASPRHNLFRESCNANNPSAAIRYQSNQRPSYSIHVTEQSLTITMHIIYSANVAMKKKLS